VDRNALPCGRENGPSWRETTSARGEKKWRSIRIKHDMEREKTTVLGLSVSKHARSKPKVTSLLLFTFSSFEKEQLKMPPKALEEKKKSISRSAKAGLQFPVGRIHRYLKKESFHRMRVSGTSAIYLAAILEYLCAEVLELAGNGILLGSFPHAFPFDAPLTRHDCLLSLPLFLSLQFCEQPLAT
jgi:hypothetical protein